MGPDNIILKFNFTSVMQFPLLKTIPAFYQEAIVCFNKSKPHIHVTSKEALFKEILWGNRILTFFS